MSEMAIPYEIALQRYPQQVAEIISKLRHGKSKIKNCNPEEVNWYFTWCTRINGPCDFASAFTTALNNAANPPPEPTIEQKVQEYITNSTVCLAAKKGHWWANSHQEITMPPEIVNDYRNMMEDQERKHQKYLSLTPEERNIEIAKLIGKLRGTSVVVARMV